MDAFAHERTRYAQRKHTGDESGGMHVSMRGTVVDNERSNPHPERSSSIVLGEAGRVHFPPTYSDYVERQQHKNLPWHLEHSAEYVERGKKYLAGKIPGDDKPQGRRYLTENPSDIATFHLKWNTKARASCNESFLHDMEGYMNRKQRIPSHNDQRNGIPEATPGDKFYKKAEREPGFFSRKNGKPSFKRTDDTRKPAAFKSTMTFAEKTRRAELENDVNDIRDLDNPGEKLKQVVPSWEERTGAYLVRPEDEKY